MDRCIIENTGVALRVKVAGVLGYEETIQAWRKLKDGVYIAVINTTTHHLDKLKFDILFSEIGASTILQNNQLAFLVCHPL